MKNISEKKETIIAPITSAMGGSVSLIRISGTKALSATAKYFSNETLKKAAGHKIYSGYFNGKDGEILDQVVVYYYKAPKSYTGEDVIEISFHANPLIVNEAIDLFIKDGCRFAEPGEFTQRAFLNGKMDLVQAEAVADMINAKSKNALKNTVKNLNGKLSEEISEIKTSLINTASLLELDLDFTDEDLEIIQKEEIISGIKPVREKIVHLLETYRHNKIMDKGIEVLITGKPNVGKSSLMNALLKRDRVIVSDIPGTTRDIIHEDVIQNGHIVRYIDTAGIHYTDNKIEIEGVERAKKLINEVDIILLVLDLSEKFSAEDKKLITRLCEKETDKTILIGNKTDKKIKEDNLNYLSSKKDKIIKVSATANKGITETKKRINDRINQIDKQDREEIYLTNFRHYEALKKAQGYLNSLIDGINKNIGYEFLALDLRQTIESLAEILGEITTDDVLNNIFSHYCIGK
jgi:tRNA modification GTPase